MWQRLFRKGDGSARTGRHPVRRLLWLLPALVALLGGAQAAAPAFAAVPLTVSVISLTPSVQTGVAASFFGSVQNPQPNCTPIYSFLFSDGNNPPAGTTNPVTHIFNQPGTAFVTLTVTDACQNTGTSQPLAVTITGTGTGGTTGSCTPTAGTPITASITPNNQSVATGATVSFFAGAGGTTGTPTFSFNFGDGATSSGTAVTHAYTNAGTYIVTLTVSDQAGRVGCASGTVTVSGGSTGGTSGTCTPTAGGIITASITPNNQTAAVGAIVSFVGVAGGTAGNPSYFFNFGDGSTATGVTVTHPYSTAGTFIVTLTVSDQTGRIACGNATVTITGTGSGGTTTGSNPNIRVAPNGPYTGVPGQPVNFGAFAQTFNQGATITGYQWNFGDNTATGSGQFVSHTYTSAGSYTVTLTVTDSSGQSSSATTTATIGGGTAGGGTTSNTTNSATANGVTANTGGPYSGSSGAPIAFNTTASTANPGASIVSCVLSFGDNSTSAPCQGATHVYNSNGSYTAVITVTDSTGAVVAASTTVTVGGGSRTVTLVAGCNNVSSTFTDGTPTGTVATAVSPQASVLSLWKLADPATARYRGFFPGSTQASDLPTLNRLDAIFICVNAAATLTEPSA